MLDTADIVFYGAMLYFIPTWIAWKKRNLAAIFALNLLLGWTFIGWVVALVWALIKDPDYVPPQRLDWNQWIHKFLGSDYKPKV
jgi:hypothetical protein